MKQCLLDLSIAELVDRYPSCLEVLRSEGFEMFADPETLKAFGRLLKLRTILAARKIDPELFCGLLERGMSEAECLGIQPAIAKNINLLALLPCPLKVPIENAFTTFIEGLPAEKRFAFSSCIEGNANNRIDYAGYADHFESLDEMPDIIITPGFNRFFYPHFVEQFIKTGRFAAVASHCGDQCLLDLNLVDPGGHYTMLTMNLLLPVVDHARLGDRPIPKRWADLLDPVYRGVIAIRGYEDGTFCETVLLSLFKDFGREGIEMLGKNVAYGWHPSRMVKAAADSGAEGPAISVMPLFFANTIKNRERVSIVWPEDGAIVSPVTMLVKAEKRDSLQEVISFLSGPEVARICAGAYFPSLHPEADNRLPADVRFKWIGWDFIKENDLEALIDKTNEMFLHGFTGGAQ